MTESLSDDTYARLRAVVDLVTEHERHNGVTIAVSDLRELLAENDHLRSLVAGPGSSQPADCPSDAAAGLRGADEAGHSVCPHVVTDGATSHCGLAEQEVARLQAENAERNAALINTVRRVVDKMDNSGHYPATGWAYDLLVAADQAEGTR